MGGTATSLLFTHSGRRHSPEPPPQDVYHGQHHKDLPGKADYLKTLVLSEILWISGFILYAFLYLTYIPLH